MLDAASSRQERTLIPALGNASLEPEFVLASAMTKRGTPGAGSCSDFRLGFSDTLGATLAHLLHKETTGSVTEISPL
jgi:hypothetical protein